LFSPLIIVFAAKKLDTNKADSYNEALVEEALFTEDIAKIESLRNLTNCSVIIGDRVYIFFLTKKEKERSKFGFFSN
jgi:hypothetical protein